MPNRHLVATLALATAFFVNLAHAQVNRCQDASGKLVYSDRPCTPGQQGEQIERKKSQAEIAREREQAYSAEMRKQQRNLAEQQSDFGSPADRPVSQAPVARQAGGDWAARKAQENAATSAGSISKNGSSWDRAAEAERDRVRQEEARRRAEAMARAQAQEDARPKPSAITSCIGNSCWDDKGGSYNRATGDRNQMTGPNGQQCRWSAPTKQWECR